MSVFSIQAVSPLMAVDREHFAERSCNRAKQERLDFIVTFKRPLTESQHSAVLGGLLCYLEPLFLPQNT